MDDLVSEFVELAVDRIAADIAARDSKWNFRLLSYMGDGEPIFFPEHYADAYQKYEFRTQAIGTVAFDDKEGQ